MSAVCATFFHDQPVLNNPIKIFRAFFYPSYSVCRVNKKPPCWHRTENPLDWPERPATKHSDGLQTKKNPAYGRQRISRPMQCCQAENQTKNLKIRLLSDQISTKNQTKSGPKLAILRSKSDLFQKIVFDIEQIKFYLEIFHI